MKIKCITLYYIGLFTIGKFFVPCPSVFDRTDFETGKTSPAIVLRIFFSTRQAFKKFRYLKVKFLPTGGGRQKIFFNLLQMCSNFRICNKILQDHDEKKFFCLVQDPTFYIKKFRGKNFYLFIIILYLFPTQFLTLIPNLYSVLHTYQFQVYFWGRRL